MTGRLVLLATSPRVPAGLLSLAAWDALRGAAEVRAVSLDHALANPLRDAGVPLEAIPDELGTAELAALLVDRAAAAQGPVVFLLAADGDPDLVAALTAGGSAVELLHGSWDLPGARLLDLVAVMDRLRSPGGCPWDAEQTHLTLLPYLLEESYETVEVIESGDLVGLREELGDLLLQVVFHARIGEEHAAQPWSVDDVADGIVTKLVTRHPHVFADADADSAAAVEAGWEALKRAEKGRTSVVDGVPLAQPALALAAKLLSRSARVGIVVDRDALPPPLTDGVLADLVGTPRDAGALLLEVVAAAGEAGVDAETALRAAARELAQRVRSAEQSR